LSDVKEYWRVWQEWNRVILEIMSRWVKASASCECFLDLGIGFITVKIRGILSSCCAVVINGHKRRVSDKRNFIGRIIKNMAKKKRTYRTFGQLEEEYFLKHPEEIDEYLSIIFDEYAKDGDMGALLSSLRRVVRAKGVSRIAKEAHLTRNGLQKALSLTGNPKFENIHIIMRAMGYRLMPQKMKVGA